MTKLILPRRRKLLIPSFAAGLAAASPADAMPARPGVILSPAVSAQAEKLGHRLSTRDYEFAMFMMAKMLGMLSGGGGDALAAWNPAKKNANITLSAENTVATSTLNDYANVYSATSHASGKRYCEVSITGSAGTFSNRGIGVANASASVANGVYIGSTGDNSLGLYANGFIYVNGAGGGGYATFASGTPVKIAVDRDAGKLWIGTGSTWAGMGGTPDAGTGGYPLSITGAIAAGAGLQQSGDVAFINTGQAPFSQTIPTGYLPWG